ncbi:MAG TPA: GNAT family N-acetyltransferase [Phenylobacterium sp.]|nr:GNAT family N-acetyltransferase [Phenylobacterium sp.]
MRSDDPPQEAYLQLWEVLKAFNVKMVGDCESRTFSLLLRDPDSDAVMGGLWARSLWGSFYVDMLVAPEGHRGSGLGRDLMTQAEAEARARGCQTMWLDTFAFQARPFYEKLGFRVFGQIDGAKPAFPRYFMVKDLG